MIAAIVLSAGASTRMGTPKGLLVFRGRTFLETILDASDAVGLKPRVVALGHDSDKMLARHDLSVVTTVNSEDLTAGPIGSIRAGIRALLNQSVDAAVVWGVDRPHVHVDTVRALVDEFRSRHAPIVIPTFDGRHGHPVLFGREVFEELLTAPDETGAKWVTRRDPARVAEVVVDDPAVVENIDTPEAYQRLLKRLDSTRE